MKFKSNYLLVIIIGSLFLGSCSSSKKENKAYLDHQIQQVEATFNEGQFSEAFDLVKPLLNSGSEKALFYYAKTAVILKKPDVSDELIFGYYQEAANKGLLDAMWEMSRAYELGIGVEPDLLKSIDWQRKFKELKALSRKKNQYLDPNTGEFISEKQATENLKASAKSGNADAVISMAMFYDSGNRVKKDPAQAYQLLLGLANTGDAYASLMVGYYLCRGIGVGRDVDQANNWLIKSKRKVICIN